jgi:hypothetical protein
MKNFDTIYSAACKATELERLKVASEAAWAEAKAAAEEAKKAAWAGWAQAAWAKAEALAVEAKKALARAEEAEWAWVVEAKAAAPRV